MALRKRSTAPYQFAQDIRKGPDGKERKGNWTIRFSVNGKQRRVSTRTTDYEEAVALAPALYKSRVGSYPTYKSLPVLMGEYLAAREGQISDLEWAAIEDRCSRLLIPHFGDVDGITGASVEKYIEKRLKKVQGSTVDKELTALRAILNRARRVGDLEEVPEIRKVTEPGTECKPRPEIDVSPERAEAVLAQLKDTTKFGKHPKAAFTLVYEYGLRWGSTIEKLRTPRNYKPGMVELNITTDTDKNKFARKLPLTERARDALDLAIGDRRRAFIFGPKYDGRKALRTAAKNTGMFEEWELEHLDARDFRHACGNRLAAAGASLSAIAFILGDDEATVAKHYLRPQPRAAKQAIAEHIGKLAG